MKKFLFILLLIIGCKPETTSDNSNIAALDSANVDVAATEAAEPAGELDAGRQLEANGVYQFENEDIGAYPFVKDFEPMLSAIGEYKIAKTPVRNVQDSAQTDTLIKVTFGRSAIEYYKIQASSTGFITGATIGSNEVELKMGIKIGMSLEEFVSIFAELKGQGALRSVIISTEEGLNQTEFVFVNNRLSAVKYQSYFD
ncbi:MAG TPA: hypothetical protein VF490_18590 [Chryseosolibacter sp.]